MAVYDEADSSPIAGYLFMGGATISGIFVDSNGEQVGAGFSGGASITQAKRLYEIAGFSGLPSGAVGAIVNVSADVYYAICAADASLVSSFQGAYSTNYPKQAGPAFNIGFGKVR